MSQDPNISKSEEFREAELASDMNVAKVHGSILREQAEPSDGYEPVSLWLITFALGLVFWAGMYLVSHSGGFKADEFNSNLMVGGGTGGAAAEKGPPDPMVVGKRVFTQYCVVCHQTTGLGVKGQFPPLAGSEWVLGQDWHGENHLVKIVLNGLQGPVVVKGENYNNAMAPWGAVLKDDQIAAVLTYVRNSWGNSAPPVTPEFVAKIREETASRTEAWTQNDLQAIPAVRIEASTPAAAEPAPAPPAAPGTGSTAP